MKNMTNNYWMLLSLCLSMTLAYAQNTPRELASIIDMRAQNLDRVMNDNGYTFIKGDKSNNSAYGYWWNQRGRKCVVTRTTNGRVQSVVTSLPADCNKSMNGGNNNNDYDSNYRNDTEAQSYRRGYDHGERNQRKRNLYGSQIQIRAYDKGYSDGRAGRPMDKAYLGGGGNNGNNDYNSNHRNDTEAQSYRRGYDHGDRNQRKRNPYSSQIQIRAYDQGYRDGRAGNPMDLGYVGGSGSGGNNGDGRYRDLQDWVATSAYEVLKTRGFREVKKHTQNGKTYRLWEHRRSNKCIKTLSENKKIKEIMESDNCD